MVSTIRATGFNQMSNCVAEPPAKYGLRDVVEQPEGDLVLRDALIEQIAIRTKYENGFEKAKKYYNIPIIKNIIRKIIAN